MSKEELVSEGESELEELVELLWKAKNLLEESSAEKEELVSGAIASLGT